MWVDDITLADKDDKTMKDIKDDFKGRFKMKDLGPISRFLGIIFSQKDWFDMAVCKPRATPSKIKPSSYDNEKTGYPSDILRYREMIVSLVYAMTCTR